MWLANEHQSTWRKCPCMRKTGIYDHPTGHFPSFPHQGHWLTPRALINHNDILNGN